MTAVEYIQSLEKKVEELESLLNRDGSQDVEEASTPPTPPSTFDKPYSTPSAKSPPPKPAHGADAVALRSGKSPVSGSDEDVIETMVGAGEYESSHTSSSERYRGSFAGLSLLQRVHNLCRHVSAARKNSDVGALQDDFIHAFDFASPDSDSTIPLEAFALLPPRESFDRAIDIVVDLACCNLSFLDRPTLEMIADEVYPTAAGESRNRSRKPFALLYAVLALSRRFEAASAGDINTAQSIRGYAVF